MTSSSPLKTNLATELAETFLQWQGVKLCFSTACVFSTASIFSRSLEVAVTSYSFLFFDIGFFRLGDGSGE